MVSINGLPPSIVPGSAKTGKTKRKKDASNSESTEGIGKPSKIANAVSQSIRHVNESDIPDSGIQYDLPQGRSRQAMEHYLGVLNQAKRDELARLIGVDLYI